MHLRCNYCGKDYWGGVIQMKNHLAGTHDNVGACSQVSEDVMNMFLQLLSGKKQDNIIDVDCFEEKNIEGKSKGGTMDAYVTKGRAKQQSLNQMMKQREPVIRDICRVIYGHALAFNLVKSPLFKKMLKSVGEYGVGLKPPSYHEVRVSFLKKEVNHVNASLEVYRKEWKKTGCTIMSDGWTDGKSCSLANFLVNSPNGTVFIKSIDTSGVIKNSMKLFEMLDDIVNEIGEENVVQVVTDSASAYVGAGRLLEVKRTKLFWFPCAAHCLDLMLSNIDRKLQLRAMFASEEWARSSYSTSVNAKKAQGTILGDARFWKAIKYCLKCVLPLVKILRLVDDDAKPAMGFIYEAMDRAKEEIASNLNHVRGRYKRIWEIIDTRWDLQLHRPLHAAAYYLNPM
ncbi:uncharacterized protein LOC114293451 [Camellia sinensis]|uniref:uncharacterized protein LOC114293451 n=1 Tax=Camellia sinensis TaxID=4442 RepID=UPI001036D60B|nr:uncharacterized protein LOC114293451 [Camellia sinensis]